MKLRSVSFLLLLHLCLVSFAAGEGLFPERPRCEYLDNPIGLDEVAPRLSWEIKSPKRASRQIAYHILVASSAERLSSNQGDFWDTGKVISQETNAVVYHGKAPRSGQRLWWKVRVWDEQGNLSSWTPNACWETALLLENDWHGPWIGRNTDLGIQPLPLLRRIFDSASKAKCARLYVTGLGYYEVHLNGTRVGDQLLAPGYTRYDRRVLYSTYDVTEQLRRGENVLGVMLGNGWFNVQTATAWNFDAAPWRASPRLRLELRIEFADGKTEIVSSDKTWKTNEGPITFSSIFGGETYDARREQPGWDLPGFDDQSWSPAEILAAPKGRLVAQAMPAIKAHQILRATAIHELHPGTYVFDFGENLSGFAEITVRGAPGTQVSLKYGEQLANDGTVDQSAIATHVWSKGKNQSFQTDRYILKGEGIETWHSRFDYHGFRYVEVTGATEPLPLEALHAYILHTAVESTGQFSCSNALLNQIWENTRRSYLNNLFGLFTDCPQREKNGWTGDAQLACEFGLLNYDAVTVYEKWIDDIADEQRSTGELPGIVPTPGWGYTRDCGPAWDSAFLLIPYFVNLYYGDSRMLERHYEAHCRYVDFLTANKAKSGIVENGIGDWLPWKTITPQALTSTSYYYVDALIVADTARKLGRRDDEAKYRALAVEIRRAFNAKFFEPTTGQYANGSQTSLSCALYQGLVETSDQPSVAANLLAAVNRNGLHIDTGILGSKYLLRALTATGQGATAYRIAAQDTLPSWGYWVKQGSTTLWENWDGKGSQDHVMFGDISAWFVQALAGLTPDRNMPGLRHVTIEPHPVDNLTFAKAIYASARGRFAIDWELKNGIFQLRLSIPPNCSGTLVLPGADANKIRESGLPLNQVQGVSLNGAKDGRVILEVVSGDYHFSSSP